ncbi:MAG: YdeI/OmpD-associated family protein [Bacteroidota bacterium]|nr:YdeI/OmpD-associated family protein [Bacteroidota bacterium]
MDKPLVDKEYLLEKFPGKGGWTFARIPEIKQNKKAHFGWVKVRGSIEGFEIKKYHLMPIGDGNLFLPVKSEIRKKTKKGVGDYVHVILYHDNEPLEVPEEMLLCLQDEPMALKFFNSLTESEQKLYIDWVYSAKKEETKIDRLAKAITMLLKKQKL